MQGALHCGEEADEDGGYIGRSGRTHQGEQGDDHEAGEGDGEGAEVERGERR